MGESALPPYTGVRSERVSCLGLISLRRREASSDDKGELEESLSPGRRVMQTGRGEM
jgi:hypothetical protein